MATFIVKAYCGFPLFEIEYIIRCVKGHYKLDFLVLLKLGREFFEDYFFTCSLSMSVLSL